MVKAVQIPIMVIIFCPDFHSSLRLSKVISDNICAAIIHNAVNEKKRFKFEINVNVVVIPALITNTAARWAAGSLGDRARANTGLVVRARETSNALELQIIECMVPIIADRIARWIITKSHVYCGNTTLKISDNGMHGFLKSSNGVAKIIDAINTVYKIPTMTIE